MKQRTKKSESILNTMQQLTSHTCPKKRTPKISFLVTVVKQVDLLDIQRTEAFQLTKLYTGFLWSDGDLPRPFSKVVCPVMHYGSVIIRDSQAVDSIGGVLVEVMSLVFFCC